MSTPGPRRRSATGVYTQVWDGYSLAERDRRWAAVRAKASEAGFDCVFVPIGDGINARYLTQFRASSVVLPADSRGPIVITDRGSSNAWLPEPRLTAREWSVPMAQALLDAGMEGARIGVTGLRGGRFGHVSQTDGVVCHSAFAEVCRRLPNAPFEDATDLLGQVRYRKGGEEIECIRRAAEIAQAGVEEFRRQVAAGAEEAVIRARVLGLMLRMGSEYYPLRLFEMNGGWLAHVHAVWGTQVVRMIQGPAEVEGFEAAVEHLRPGGTFRKFFAAHPRVVLQGIGAGDDGPVLTAESSSDLLDMPIEPDTAFTLTVGAYAKPVVIGDHQAMSF